MKRIFQHIVFALALLMTSFSLTGCKEDGIIEEDVMAQIYAEMFVTDQWLNANVRLRTVADTSMVYEPILEKYGYNRDDYRRSIEYYLQDPEDYADIMETTKQILDKQLDSLNVRKAELDRMAELSKYVKSIAKDVKFSESWSFVGGKEEFENPDSLAFEWDTLAGGFKMVPLHRCDSIPQCDSLMQCDTVALTDSTAIKADLQVLDTLPKIDTTRKPRIIKDFKPAPYKINAGLKVSDSLSKVQRVWE